MTAKKKGGECVKYVSFRGKVVHRKVIVILPMDMKKMSSSYTRMCLDLQVSLKLRTQTIYLTPKLEETF